MTAPTLKLSNLTPGDVAVFVRADGSESEPFVVMEIDGSSTVSIAGANWSFIKWYNGLAPVRRHGRGHLVPARIVMEGEALDLSDSEELTAALSRVRQYEEWASNHYEPADGDPYRDSKGTMIFRPQHGEDYGVIVRAALAATAPKQKMSAEERLKYLCKEWGPALQTMADSDATDPKPMESP